MPYSSIADFLNNFGEGIRETNPIYRQNQRLRQEQAFQTQQRQTTTPYEDFQMRQQTQDHADMLRQQATQNVEHYQDRVSKGLWIPQDQYGNDFDPSQTPPQQSSPAQRAIAAPAAATGAADSATNGMGGGAGGNGRGPGLGLQFDP